MVGVDRVRVDASSPRPRLNVTTRPTLASDEPFIRELFIGLRAPEFHAAGLPPQILDALLGQQFQAQRSHYAIAYPEREDLIVLSGDKVIGNLVIADLPDELRLVDITLAPSYRGRGIGTSIVADLQVQASGDGKPVVLHVEMHNPARHLYQRLGFVDEELVGIYWRMRYSTMAP